MTEIDEQTLRLQALYGEVSHAVRNSTTEDIMLVFSMILIDMIEGLAGNRVEYDEERLLKGFLENFEGLFRETRKHNIHDPQGE